MYERVFEAFKILPHINVRSKCLGLGNRKFSIVYPRRLHPNTSLYLSMDTVLRFRVSQVWTCFVFVSAVVQTSAGATNCSRVTARLEPAAHSRRGEARPAALTRSCRVVAISRSSASAILLSRLVCLIFMSVSRN